jgi:hypothetical protein
MNKAKIIARIFWIFGIFVAVTGALNLGGTVDIEHAQDNMPIYVRWFFSLFALVVGLSDGFYINRTINKMTWFDKVLDRLFGMGFSDALTREIHITIVLPIFFILLGGIGLIKAKIIGPSDLLSLTFFSVGLFFGIGFSFASALYWLYWGRKKDAQRSTSETT